MRRGGRCSDPPFLLVYVFFGSSNRVFLSCTCESLIEDFFCLLDGFFLTCGRDNVLLVAELEINDKSVINSPNMSCCIGFRFFICHLSHPIVAV